MKKKYKGLFITLEGIEGAGKSTHITYLGELLKKQGREVVITREPGGTELGEQIRNLLLMQKKLQISNVSELLLMFAARAQHLSQVIIPALEKGFCVLCDRFTDSSYAYQGGGRNTPEKNIDDLVNLVHPDLRPDLTLLFDLPVETGLCRAKKNRTADRFESETIQFFQSARSVFLEIAKTDPERVKIINAENDPDTVRLEIKNIISTLKLC